jgi:hypothetical protein
VFKFHSDWADVKQQQFIQKDKKNIIFCNEHADGSTAQSQGNTAQGTRVIKYLGFLEGKKTF